MRKKRIQGAQRGTGRAAGVAATRASQGAAGKTSGAPSAVRPAGAKLRFVGISLSGGKTDKTSIAVIEYYPEQERIFLAELVDKVRPEETVSSDEKIRDFVHERKADCVSVTFDAPLTLPPLLRDPDHGEASLAVKWMRALDSGANKKKRPRRHLTPYTQRAVELFLAVNLEEKFDVQDAMGANLAPLTARAQYLSRQWSIPSHETMTKIAVWKIGAHFKLTKAPLKKWWNSVGGDEARRVILQSLAERAKIFFYQQDQKAMVESPHAFEALVCAYVGLLKYQGRVEPTPSGFPAGEGWIEIPYFGSYSK